MNGNGQKENQPKKNFFSAKRIATLALFVALSFVASFFEFPVFPAAPFLKLDFSGVFPMLVGFLFGPVEGGLVCLLKELLHIPFGSTGGIGELANGIVTLSFLLLPSILYRFRKGFSVVCLTLSCACLLQTGVGLLTNRYIMFPLYMSEGAGEAFASLWGYVAAFNLLKSVALSVVVILLYKRLSRLSKRFEI